MTESSAYAFAFNSGSSARCRAPASRCRLPPGPASCGTERLSSLLLQGASQLMQTPARPCCPAGHAWMHSASRSAPQKPPLQTGASLGMVTMMMMTMLMRTSRLGGRLLRGRKRWMRPLGQTERLPSPQTLQTMGWRTPWRPSWQKRSGCDTVVGVQSAQCRLLQLGTQPPLLAWRCLTSYKTRQKPATSCMQSTTATPKCYCVTVGLALSMTVLRHVCKSMACGRLLACGRLQAALPASQLVSMGYDGVSQSISAGRPELAPAGMPVQTELLLSCLKERRRHLETGALK